MKKLNIMSRLMALAILPKETNLALWKVINGLKQKLSFTEEEIKDYEITVQDERTSWNAIKDIGKDIDFTEAEEKMIIEGLKALDQQKKISEQHIPLCMIFGLIE